MGKVCLKWNSKITLKKNIKVLQYLLIYLLFLEQDSCLYTLYGMQIRYFVLGLCFVIYFLSSMKKDISLLLVILMLDLFILATSVLNGGRSGFSLICSVTEQIIIAYVAYAYCPERFVYRFVKVVLFYTCISLFFWGWGLFAPNTVLGLFKAYDVGWTYDYRGIWIYTARLREMGRNVSIFREPGLYQIVLNTAIYFCLFLKEQIPYKVNKILIVLTIAVISTGSATGYIALGIMLFVFILKKSQKDDKKWKCNILWLLLLAIIALAVEYYYNGQNSILQIYLFDKVMRTSDLSAISTGSVRMGTILLCLRSIFEHPFGMGYYNAVSYLGAIGSVGGYAIVGAKLLITMVGIGFIPVLITVGFLFYRSYKNTKDITLFILFITLYLNTALAQSREFYPALIVIAFVKTMSIQCTNTRTLKMERGD